MSFGEGGSEERSAVRAGELISGPKPGSEP